MFFRGERRGEREQQNFGFLTQRDINKIERGKENEKPHLRRREKVLS